MWAPVWVSAAPVAKPIPKIKCSGSGSRALGHSQHGTRWATCVLSVFEGGWRHGTLQVMVPSLLQPLLRFQSLICISLIWGDYCGGGWVLVLVLGLAWLGLACDGAFRFGADPFALAALSHLCALTAPYFGSRPKVSKGLAPPGALRCASGPLATVSLQGIAIYALQATLRFATSAKPKALRASPFATPSLGPSG